MRGQGCSMRRPAKLRREHGLNQFHVTGQIILIQSIMVENMP